MSDSIIPPVDTPYTRRQKSIREKSEWLSRGNPVNETQEEPATQNVNAESQNVSAAAVDYSRRVAIAREHGLPEALASRLTGSNDSELRADASRLANSALFKTEEPPAQISKTEQILRMKP